MNPSIVITGVGAVIGQGIIKSLNGSSDRYRLIGIDANPNSVGFNWTDASYSVPRTDDPRWADSIIDVCNRENTVILLPGIEQDVKALLRHLAKVVKNTHALPLLNSHKALAVGFDKWELYIFASQNDIKMPLTCLATDVNIGSLDRFVYPLLLKPRKGMAGKGIYKVGNVDDLQFQMKHLLANEYIVQQYVGSDDEEYTVSVFGFKDGNISEPFVLKRRLNYGSTFEAETFTDPKLSAIANRTAQLINIVGPTNFQFRRASDEYYLIEINPRFSSAVSIRSAFGFNEPLMAVESFLEGKSDIRLNLKTGRCFRYIEDNIIFT